MITPSMCTLALALIALLTSSTTSRHHSHNGTDIPPSPLDILQTGTSLSLLPTQPQSPPHLLPRSDSLHRRILVDNSCPPDTVNTLTRLMERIERISRWAVEGAALRPSRGGRGGRGRGRGGRGGQGRGGGDAFAENAFQNNFTPYGSGPSANIPLSIRSAVRRRFIEIAEQASRIRRADDGGRESRREQVYHCEREGDTEGFCETRARGSPITFVHEAPWRWVVICPPFYTLPALPVQNTRFFPNQFIALVESLLGSPSVVRAVGLYRFDDGLGLQWNLNRYIEYAHDLYYHPISLPVPEMHS